MNTLVILPLTILLIVLGVKAGPGEAAGVPPVWPVGQQTGGGPGVIIQPVPKDQAPISTVDPSGEDTKLCPPCHTDN